MSSRLIVTVALGLSALGCRANAASSVVAVEPVAVRTTVALRSDGHPLVLRGALEASARLRLGFAAGGRVRSVDVQEGERVRRGQVLARLDASDLAARARAARSTLEQAERQARRTESLEGAGAIGTASREDAASALERAEADLALVQDGLSHAVLRAPSDGFVVDRVVEPGEVVGPGTSVVVVDQGGARLVRVGVAERDLERVRAGVEVALRAEEADATCRGVVLSVDESPATSDGLYEVRIAPDDECDVPLGAILTVMVDGMLEATAFVRVPLLSIVHRLDEDFVFVIVDAAERPSVRRVEVELGRAFGRDVIVASGLRGGERVVAEGAYFLDDGERVRIVR